MEKPLVRVLAALGCGSRKECTAFVRHGRVRVGGEVAEHPQQMVETEGLEIELDGERLESTAPLYLMLNKPLGYECSTRPSLHAGILSILPERFEVRGVQPAGRLDVETTGLLLLSDDGAFLHHVTSPKRKITKTYLVHTEEIIEDSAIESLLKGVVLTGDDFATVALSVERLEDPHALRLVIDHGRYHVVRRMIAAIGGTVTSLHREKIGDVSLPDDLKPGTWRLLTSAELDALNYKGK